MCFSSPSIPELKLTDTELEIKCNGELEIKCKELEIKCNGTVCEKQKPDIYEEVSDKNLWAKEEQEPLTRNS